MLTNMNSMLSSARADGRAVGSFNGYSHGTIQGILKASRQMNTPVILAFGERYLSDMSFEDFVLNARYQGRDNSPEYAIHLDHCKSLNNVYRALAAGFTSVMYDGSALPFDENVANTKKAVEVAHAMGASVEAELGSIGAGHNTQEGDGSSKEALTNPAQAAQFVEETGVDALAVSIGTVHGGYKGDPDIRLEVLEQIRDCVSIPLVLHGGSGTPEQTLRACIDRGIAKINVNTEISSAAISELALQLTRGRISHLSQLEARAVQSITDTCIKYITIFNN